MKNFVFKFLTLIITSFFLCIYNINPLQLPFSAAVEQEDLTVPLMILQSKEKEGKLSGKEAKKGAALAQEYKKRAYFYPLILAGLFSNKALKQEDVISNRFLLQRLYECYSTVTPGFRDKLSMAGRIMLEMLFAFPLSNGKAITKRVEVIEALSSLHECDLKLLERYIKELGECEEYLYSSDFLTVSDFSLKNYLIERVPGLIMATALAFSMQFGAGIPFGFSLLKGVLGAEAVMQGLSFANNMFLGSDVAKLFLDSIGRLSVYGYCGANMFGGYYLSAPLSLVNDGASKGISSWFIKRKVGQTLLKMCEIIGELSKMFNTLKKRDERCAEYACALTHLNRELTAVSGGKLFSIELYSKILIAYAKLDVYVALARFIHDIREKEKRVKSLGFEYSGPKCFFVTVNSDDSAPLVKIVSGDQDISLGTEPSIDNANEISSLLHTLISGQTLGVSLVADRVEIRPIDLRNIMFNVISYRDLEFVTGISFCTPKDVEMLIKGGLSLDGLEAAIGQMCPEADSSALEPVITPVATGVAVTAGE